MSEHYATNIGGETIPRPGTLPDPRVRPSKDVPFAQPFEDFVRTRSAPPRVKMAPAAPQLDEAAFERFMEMTKRRSNNNPILLAQLREMFNVGRANVDIYNSVVQDTWTLVTEEFGASQGDLIRLRNCYEGMRRSTSRIGSIKDLFDGVKGATGVELALSLAEESDRVIADIARKHHDSFPEGTGTEPVMKVHGSDEIVAGVLLEAWKEPRASRLVRRELSSAYNAGKISPEELTRVDARLFEKVGKMLSGVIDLTTEELMKAQRMRPEEKDWFMALFSRIWKDLAEFDPGADAPPPRISVRRDVNAKRTRNGDNNEEEEEEESPRFAAIYEGSSLIIRRLFWGMAMFFALFALLSGIGVPMLRMLRRDEENMTQPMSSMPVTKLFAKSVSDLRERVIEAHAETRPDERDVITAEGNVDIPAYQRRVEEGIKRDDVRMKELTSEITQLAREFVEKAEQTAPLDDLQKAADVDRGLRDEIQNMAHVMEQARAPNTEGSELSRKMSEGLNELSKEYTFDNFLFRKFNNFWESGGRSDTAVSAISAPATGPERDVSAVATTVGMSVESAFSRIIAETAESTGPERTREQLSTAAEAVLSGMRGNDFTKRGDVREWIDMFSSNMESSLGAARKFAEGHEEGMRKESDTIAKSIGVETERSRVVRATVMPRASEYITELEKRATELDTLHEDYNRRATDHAVAQAISRSVTDVIYGSDGGRMTPETENAVNAFTERGGQMEDCMNSLYYQVDPRDGIGTWKDGMWSAVRRWYGRAGAFGGDMIWVLLGGRAFESATASFSLVLNTLQDFYREETMDWEGAIWLLFESAMLATNIIIMVRQQMSLLRIVAFLKRDLSAVVTNVRASASRNIRSMRQRVSVSGSTESELPLWTWLFEKLDNLGIWTGRAARGLERVSMRTMATVAGFSLPGYVTLAVQISSAVSLLRIGAALMNTSLEALPEWAVPDYGFSKIAVIVGISALFGVGVMGGTIFGRPGAVLAVERARREAFFQVIGTVATAIATWPYHVGGLMLFKARWFDASFRRTVRRQVATGRVTSWQILLLETLGNAVNVVWMEYFLRWGPLLGLMHDKTPHHARDVSLLAKKRTEDGLLPIGFPGRSMRATEDARRYISDNQVAMCDQLIEDIGVAEHERFNRHIKFWSEEETDWESFQKYAPLLTDWKMQLLKAQQRLDDNEVPRSEIEAALAMWKQVPELLGKSARDALLPK